MKPPRSSGRHYVILDIEFPRPGLIRIDAVEQVLVQFRESMK
jgi:hypothetical protein